MNMGAYYAILKVGMKGIAVPHAENPLKLRFIFALSAGESCKDMRGRIPRLNNLYMYADNA